MSEKDIGPDTRPPNGEPEAEALATPAAAPDVGRLERERDEYLKSWQRAAADYQNLRRRIGADMESAIGRAKLALHQELLLVLDCLDLALSAPCETPEGQGLRAGVLMTKEQLVRTLEREGVAPLPEPPEGAAFDAATCEAIESVAGSGKPAGTILSVVRRGWARNGQVLRPMQVRVAAPPEIGEG